MRLRAFAQAVRGCGSAGNLHGLPKVRHQVVEVRDVSFRPVVGRYEIAVLWVMLLGGCDNSTPETTATTRETIDIRKPVDDDTLRAMSFLNITDGDLAARWLVLKERQDEGSRVPSTEEIGAYARRIEHLANLLVEDRRMIANRTVQTRDLLAERNIQETLPRLLDGMERAAPRSSASLATTAPTATGTSTCERAGSRTSRRSTE